MGYKPTLTKLQLEEIPLEPVFKAMLEQLQSEEDSFLSRPCKDWADYLERWHRIKALRTMLDKAEDKCKAALAARRSNPPSFNS